MRLITYEFDPHSQSFQLVFHSLLASHVHPGYPLSSYQVDSSQAQLQFVASFVLSLNVPPLVFWARLFSSFHDYACFITFFHFTFHVRADSPARIQQSHAVSLSIISFEFKCVPRVCRFPAVSSLVVRSRESQTPMCKNLPIPKSEVV